MYTVSRDSQIAAEKYELLKFIFYNNVLRYVLEERKNNNPYFCNHSSKLEQVLRYWHMNEQTH